jgi:hypothetical protein
MVDENLLTLGNEAFKRGDYIEALRCYERLLLNAPDVLRDSLQFNRKLTERRLRALHGEQTDQLIQDVQKQLQLEDEIAAVRPHFDVAFYLEQYPDVAEAGVDPILHYCTEGWREGRDPHPNFSTLFYQETYPDIRDADINPYWHYVTAGMDEGRLPSERSQSVPSNDEATSAESEELEILKPHFDVEFYLRNNSDLANSQIEPLTHYIRFGWKEDRDPSPEFSTKYYLEANPDIRAAGINPFLHYIQTGKQEGRLSQHPGGYRAETLAKTLPLEETVRLWRSKPSPSNLLTHSEIIAQLKQRSRGALNDLIVSIGHDNYLEVSGGVQLCIQREQEIAHQHGFVYLNLHPYQPLPRLAHISDDPDVKVCLIIDGNVVGVAPMSQIVTAFSYIKENFGTIRTVVHHLMGHNPEQIADLVEASGQEDCWVWLHDFFTICPSYALQRNNIAFCGAPNVESNACRICLYGEERSSHQRKMQEFFIRLKVHVISPSEFTAEFWSSKSNLSVASLAVVEHVTLEWTESDYSSVPQNGPITVAFVGYPAPHKGWPVFEKLTRSLNGLEKDMRFVYFGVSEVATSNVEHIPVQVSASKPDAMIRALKEQNVDFVVHWASCAETFSFSTFEALAAGAFVLTNPISGNVARTVKTTGLGKVLNNQEELESFFRNGAVDSAVAELRARRASLSPILKYSQMSLDVFR